jgi:hypothetical protein
MIAWLALKTGLSMLVVKIILFAVASGAILFGLRLWGNAQWTKGEAAGRVNATQIMEKLKQAEWKKIEDQLAAEKQKVTADTEKLAIQQSALNDRIAEDAKHRQQEDALYNQAVAWSKLAKEQINAEVTAVPAVELVGAVRAQSARLPSTIRQ